ncbi:MAG TPA: SUMF1/EgtB/PvdO family nonheme iron enzyme [Polyangiaceae bacterium]|jgi:formylglycine-generating enzyme required for sulfatase activity|nr:SUMF1/EgtB/PvdO family nonheme iron enzyme [Polyangiaceae bacterium]
MADPLVLLLRFSMGAALAAGPAASLDPGPSPECPSDMRLVVGTHYDEVQHFCTKPQRDAKDTHCFAYDEGITALEGIEKPIHVCVDQYEAPNKKGSPPLVMRSFNSAKRFCEDRGKRMCSEEEWETACEGPTYEPLAYGWAVDKKLCNSDKKWMEVDFAKFAQGGDVAKNESDRLWQGTPSGRFPGCVSSFGVYDMMGNVEEWVSTRPTRKWPGALMGGFWAKPWTGCRGTNDAHEPGFQFYETGFRCCAEPGTLDADGKRIKKGAR